MEKMEKGVHKINGEYYYEAWLGWKMAGLSFIGGIVIGILLTLIF